MHGIAFTVVFHIFILSGVSDRLFRSSFSFPPELNPLHLLEVVAATEPAHGI